MKFERFVVGMLETNSYLIYDDQTMEALLVDPGADVRTFIQFLNKRSLVLRVIVLTHFHCDHIGAVEELRKKYGCLVMIHKKDRDGLSDPEINHSPEFGTAVSIVPDRLLTDGDIVQVGSVALRVIHTPGHTPGSICLEIVDTQLILTGDTLFEDDLGRTDLAGGDSQAMRRTVTNKIAKWEDSVTIWPGHGESATMAEVRRRNDRYVGMLRKK